MKRFKPTYKIDKVSNIPFVLLERDNIKGIMFDVDNTLTTLGKGITEDNRKWIEEAKKLGYKICLVSNTLNVKKVKKIMTDLDIYGLYFARKPSTKAMAMALNIMDVKKEETVLSIEKYMKQPFDEAIKLFAENKDKIFEEIMKKFS